MFCDLLGEVLISWGLLGKKCQFHANSGEKGRLEGFFLRGIKAVMTVKDIQAQ